MNDRKNLPNDETYKLHALIKSEQHIFLYIYIYG